MLIKGIKKLELIADKLSVIIEFIVTLGLMLLFLLTIVEVGGRYYFNYSFHWIPEAVSFLLAFIVFFGVTCLVHRRSLLSVKIFQKLLSKRIKKIISICTWVFIIFYSWIFIWFGFSFSARVIGQLTPSGYFNLSHVRLVIPLAGILILFQSLVNLLQDIIDLIYTKKE